MIILTDRIAQARRLQDVLQRLRPCTLVDLRHATVQPAIFSTIVCDVDLGGTASFDLISAAIAHHRPRPGIPVLFLLRDPSLLTKERARIAGATSTILYNVSDEQLLNEDRASVVMQTTRRVNGPGTPVTRPPGLFPA